MATTVMNPVGMARLYEKAGDFAHTTAKFILMDIIDDIPIDTGAMLRSLRLERVRLNWRRQSTRIWVGTDHWRFTEYGARPHRITTTKGSLYNRKTKQFFGQTVNHPGVKAVAYMRRNLYKRRVIVRWS